MAFRMRNRDKEHTELMLFDKATTQYSSTYTQGPCAHVLLCFVMVKYQLTLPAPLMINSQIQGQWHDKTTPGDVGK